MLGLVLLIVAWWNVLIQGLVFIDLLGFERIIDTIDNVVDVTGIGT